jgi:hypothetical protein
MAAGESVRVNQVIVAMALLAAIASSPVTGAASAPIDASEGKPRVVVVGMYLSDVPEVDLRAGFFAFDSYLWLRWNPDDFAPTGTSHGDAGDRPRSPADSYEVMGVHDLQTGEITSQPGYAVFRVQGKVRQQFDLVRFPLDEHVLSIRVQDADSEIHKVVYEPDAQNSVARGFHIHGWQAGAFQAVSSVDEFDTNFGDESLPTHNKSEYSCVAFELPLIHNSWPFFFKLTAALYIATLVAILAFLIRPIDLDPRFGLPIGALFAAVASQWMVSEALPDRSGLTLADWLHIASFIVIFLTLLLSVVSLHLYERGNEKGSARFDKSCGVFLVAAYALSCLVIVTYHR